jgi:Rod binding domain-containing protein
MIDPISASLSTAPNEPPPKDAAQAATHFEALLINQILSAAHDESGDEDSTTGAMWSLAAQQFSQIMAAQGGFGLATMIRKSLPSR